MAEWHLGVGLLDSWCAAPARPQVAFAESVALLGFTFAFIGGGEWVYVAGAAFALFRFWTGTAPTRAALAEDQQRLDARGCMLNLIAALRTAPPRAT